MAKEDVAISIQDVYKSFKLPHEQHSGLKQLIVNFYKRRRGYEVQEVIKGISLDIKKGEFFGVVGKNGSGKSTLLKLLAGIYAPTRGHVQINGSLTPFIELGVGFNPELTGRENVFLNGALLGFNRKEMEAMYDDIVSFAELKRFMDQKLKNYSSGMQVRLAFSIAIRAKSDILVLDEVLAVGDTAFQKKCFDYFRKLKEQQQTIVLVTHDMKAVETFCNRVMVLNDGRIEYVGNPYTAASKYAALNQDGERPAGGKKDTRKLGEKARVLTVKPISSKDISLDEKLKIQLKCSSLTDNLVVGLSIVRSDNTYIAGFNTLTEGGVKINKGTIDLRCTVAAGQLMPGSYFINTSLYNEKFQLLDFQPNSFEFQVHGPQDNSRDGIVRVVHEWDNE